MDHLFEKTIGTKTIFEGKVIDLKVEEVELPDGKTSKREIIKHPGAVAVIAITQENKLVLVRQYRKALERVLYEIPAGKLEKGEEPEYTAKRELAEETGYQSDSLHYVISFYTSPGFADELVHLYYTDQLKIADQNAITDEDEFLDVVEVTLEDAIYLMKDKKIYDAKTAYAIQFLQLKQMMKG